MRMKPIVNCLIRSLSKKSIETCFPLSVLFLTLLNPSQAQCNMTLSRQETYKSKDHMLLKDDIMNKWRLTENMNGNVYLHFLNTKCYFNAEYQVPRQIIQSLKQHILWPLYEVNTTELFEMLQSHRLWRQV